METYISSTRKSLLDANHLSDFDRLWEYDGEWFEDPNHDRNGWSGVNHVVLQSADGTELGLFLKRQQNYVRRTLMHPFSGESTFACEFRALRYLMKRGVPVPRPVFFGEQPSDEGRKAILITEELLGYQPLDAALAELVSEHRFTRRLRRQIIKCVAVAVRKLHLARIQHRALYPKHVFLNLEADKPQAVFIDLEKARIKWLPIMRTLQDLATLNRDVEIISNTERLYFLQSYYGVERLKRWQKWVCKLLVRRTAKRKKAKTKHH